MANQTIPNLPAAISLNGAEELWAVQDGTDVRVTSAQLGGLATGSSVIGVPAGGTGVTTIPANDLIIGADTAPIVTVPNGTTGQFLVANTGAPPSWSTYVPGASVSDISFGATGLTPNSATSGSVTVSGVLNVASGGTGATTLAAGGILYGNDASAVQVAAVGAQGQILVGEPTGPGWLAAGTAGYLLQTNGPGADPSWVPVPGTGVATISFGSTGLTPNSDTSGVVTVAGTLVPANGGTGLTTFTAGNNALYSTSASALTAGTLPTAAGGTGLTSFSSGGAMYASSGSALTTGTLPIASGGTGATAATGSGNVVLATGPTLAAATLTSPVLDGINGNSIAGFRNRVMNGDMQIDQRNEGAAQTITAGAAYVATVDGWLAYCTGANVTGQQITSTGASGSPSLKAYRFTGAASVTGIGFVQRIEAADSYDLAGATATLSLNLANSVLGAVTWHLYYANSTDAWGTLASPTLTSIASGTFSVSSTVTNYSVQVSIPSAATTGLQVTLSVGAQTSGTWTIGNVQLEAGSKATPFERIPFGSSLARCQRRYEKTYDIGVKPGTADTSGTGSVFYQVASSSSYIGLFAQKFTVTKRADPTVVTYSPTSGTAARLHDNINNADIFSNVEFIGMRQFVWYGTISAPNTTVSISAHSTADAECYT